LALVMLNQAHSRGLVIMQKNQLPTLFLSQLVSDENAHISQYL